MRFLPRIPNLLVLLFVCIGLSTLAHADVVTDWNRITLDTQASAGAIRTPPASRALAMVHIAIFDSVNAIDRKYEGYAVEAQPPDGASPEAAAAAAAHIVLLGLYPSQQPNIDAAYAQSISQIPDGQPKIDGIDLGEFVGASILVLRSADGSSSTPSYSQPAAPGVWQPAVPGTALFVGWGQVAPFAIRSSSQFRAEGPPALTSAEYAADLNEVKSLGASNSSARTAYQTETARFWAENSQINWNHVAVSAANSQQNDLEENARLFALLNIAGADTAIAVFDSKYYYNFWRPIAAIRAADTDGNDATDADPIWTPLVATPAHPDYISQHSAFGSVAAEILTDFFGTDEIGFSLTTSTAPGGVVRSYTSFSQAAIENMESRILIGYHFRTACRHGFNQGKQIGNFTFGHVLKPLNP
jgi:hypothetical protein